MTNLHKVYANYEELASVIPQYEKHISDVLSAINFNFDGFGMYAFGCGLKIYATPAFDGEEEIPIEVYFNITGDEETPLYLGKKTLPKLTVYSYIEELVKWCKNANATRGRSIG